MMHNYPISSTLRFNVFSEHLGEDDENAHKAEASQQKRNRINIRETLNDERFGR